MEDDQGTMTVMAENSIRVAELLEEKWISIAPQKKGELPGEPGKCMHTHTRR